MKIVIVGGGTAGWIAALMISKMRPMHSVTVIESSQIGIIGAGEGSTGLLTSIIKNDIFDSGCDILEFLRETGATLKYGIMHRAWTPDLNQQYFGPIVGTSSTNIIMDGIFAHYHVLDKNKNHLSSLHGQAVDLGISPFSKSNFTFDRNLDSALHFDAHKVGAYFKKITLRKDTVNHIDDEIIDVNLNEQGSIASLLLKSGKLVDGGFFIDASGFKQVLMKKLEVKWVSYQKNLPVNSAIPFLLDYETETETPELWTTAWAQRAGWMWQIPVQDRKGCGYVFDDNFITPDQAHAEIETILGRKITPIRTLKFDTGRLEKAWEKNCLAIGLASAFAEPLEATSIHTTIVQLLNFTVEFLKPTLEATVNDGNINLYNRRTAKLYDSLKDFLVIHYMGGRTDSEFWKYITSGETATDFVKELLESCKVRTPTNRDFDIMFGNADWGLYSYVLSGIGKLHPSISKNLLDDLKPVSQARSIYDYEEMIAQTVKDKMKYSDFINFIKYSAKTTKRPL
jgi:tryptophan halogenase